ncbi:MAG: hypothetical protein U5K77_02135 [Candidatus Saccharibacteria bacterium]|nr:hypothetical protein [Candidatus Saccharibacteria bacterium]
MEYISKHASQMQEDLQMWATEHARTRSDIFELLPHNPDKYEYQSTFAHTIKGSPLDGAVTDQIATGIDNRYPKVAQAVDENHQALENIGATLDSRQNAFVATDHDELIDIALILVRSRSNLLRSGHDFDTSLIANKMITYLGVKLPSGIVPATEVIAMATDETYLNIPRPASGKGRLSTPRHAISEFNEMMVEHGLEKRLKRSAKIGKAALLFTAISGTVNKPLDTTRYSYSESGLSIPEEDQERTIVIGRANDGVLKFTQEGLTYVGSARLDPNNIQVKLSPNPRSLRTNPELTDAMQAIKALQSENDPSHYYVYDEHGKLPVIRPENQQTKEIS